MRSRVSLAAIGVALVVTVPGLEAQDDRFEWTGRIDRGDRIEVKGITGDIRAVATSGSRVEVVAVKRGAAGISTKFSLKWLKTMMA